MPSMVTANNIIAASTHNFVGPVWAVCQINAPNATRHATAPAAEIQPRLFVCDAFRTLAVFTAANINRNPALPRVEMLVRSNVLATNKVKPAVINTPSTGSPQTFRSRIAGNSPSRAIQ